MKNNLIKAILYSFLMALVLMVFICPLEMTTVSFTGWMIVFGVLFASFMIVLLNNRPMIYYFWKIGAANRSRGWMTRTDMWLATLSIVILYLAARYMLYYFVNEGSFSELGCIICLSAALSYRTLYLLHAPEDVDKFDAERKQDEDLNTFVTVAECNDVESAHIIKSLLESNGIEVHTYGESMPKYVGTIPVKVIVKRKDKEAAESIINE